MGSISLSIPQAGQTFATEGAKVATDLTTIQTWANGNVDTSNISPTAAITRSQLAGGFGNLTATSVAISTSVVDGKFYLVTAGTTTMTLPTPTANVTIGIYAASGQTGAAPVTITRGTGVINGLGVAGATSILLGTVGSYVVLLADGTNWNIVAGQQDTGWVALTLGTNIGAAAGMYTPASRLIGNQVFLRGGMQNNTGGSTSAWATVAAGSRPASTVQFVATDFVAGGGTACQVTSAGALTSFAAVLNGHILALDGLSFALS